MQTTRSDRSAISGKALRRLHRRRHEAQNTGRDKSPRRWKADTSVLRYDSKAKIVGSVDKLPD
eukprot:2927502-Pyramimonas_sp.AAC.1